MVKDFNIKKDYTPYRQHFPQEILKSGYYAPLESLDMVWSFTQPRRKKTFAKTQYQ